MRKTIKIPRILKINWISGLSVCVVFNNGESRIIDFRCVLDSLNLRDDSPARMLYNEDEFAKAKLMDNTLSWDNVLQYITLRDRSKQKVPYQIGADVLLKYSKPEVSGFEIRIGSMIREARLSMGLTQEELAMMSGTSRTYISRLENDKSDVELGTLRKIIETGLGKNLEIRIS